MGFGFAQKQKHKLVLWPKVREGPKAHFVSLKTVLLEILCSPVGPDVDSFVGLVLADVGQLGIGQVLEAVQRRRALPGHSVGQDVAGDIPAVRVRLVGLERLLDRFLAAAAEAAEIGQASEGRDVLSAELEVFPEPVGRRHVGPVRAGDLQV